MSADMRQTEQLNLVMWGKKEKELKALVEEGQAGLHRLQMEASEPQAELTRLIWEEEKAIETMNLQVGTLANMVVSMPSRGNTPFFLSSRDRLIVYDAVKYFGLYRW